MKSIKKILVTTPIIKTAVDFTNRIKVTGTVFIAILSPQKKAETILAYAKKYQCKTFIETGTFRGNRCDD